MNDQRLDDLLLAYRERRDPHSLARLFDELGPRLLGLALHLAGSGSDAEDLVQSAFLAAIEDVDSFDATRGSAAGWITGILSNRARHLRRRRASRPDPERLGLAPDGAAPGAGPPEVAGLEEERRTLRDAVRGLPARYRQVVELALEQGLGPQEIASSLGRRQGAVRTQLHRATRMLQASLPHGMALPSLLLAFEGQGLKELRQRILEAAHPGSLRATAAGAGVGLATIGKVAGAGVLASSLALAALWHPDGEGRGKSGLDQLASAPAASADEAVLLEHLASGGADGAGDAVRDEVTSPEAEAAVDEEVDELAIEPGAIREVWVHEGQHLALASGRLLDGPEGADVSFLQLPRFERAGSTALFRVPAPPELLDRFAEDPVSADCALRSVLAVDRAKLRWARGFEIRWSLPEPACYVAFSGERTFVFAITLERWEESGAGLRKTAQLRWRELTGVEAPADDSRYRWIGGFAVDPSAFEDDPLGEAVAAQRQALRDQLDSAAEAWREPGSGVTVMALAERSHAGLIDTRRFDHELSSVDIHHELREGYFREVLADGTRKSIKRKDISHPAPGKLSFCSTSADRSRVWSLGSADIHQFEVSQLGPGSLQGRELEKRMCFFEEGELFLFHSVPLMTEDWFLVQVHEVVGEDAGVVLGWKKLTHPRLVRAAELATAPPADRLLGERLTLQLRSCGGWDRAYLDGTTPIGFDERREEPFALGGPLQRGEKSSAWIDSGSIPFGMVYEVQHVSWQVTPLNDIGSPRIRIEVGGCSLVDEGGITAPFADSWSGKIVLDRRGLRSSFVDLHQHVECEVIVLGRLVSEPPR